MISFEHCFKTLIGILSGPLAFFSFKRSMHFLTPFSFTTISSMGLKGDWPLSGMFDKSSLVNTETNCLFSRFALLSALSAMIPSAFKVPILTETCFLALIYFQIFFDVESCSGSNKLFKYLW